MSGIIDVGGRSLISSTSVPRLHAVVDDSQGHSKPDTGPLNIPGGSCSSRDDVPALCPLLTALARMTALREENKASECLWCFLKP